MLSWFYRRDLKALATIYGSDKWNDHWYAQHYEFHFSGLRKSELQLLEIGVGGYDDPKSGGASLRMWKRYFPRGQIFGLDIHDKSALNEDRIRIFQGSQDDSEFLSEVVSQIGKIKIIIDDGSHRSDHVIASFQCLFPELESGGFYVVEDTQTSYLPEYGGHPEPGAAGTMMTFFSQLCDAVNSVDISNNSGFTDIENSVKALHFYHNLIVIEKA
jgi:hypothetical protein